MSQEIVYAESLDESVNSAKTILKIGTGIILGFVSLGLATTAGGWLLDIAQKQKLKLYMEISTYLLGMLVAISFFIIVFMKVKEVANM